MLVTRIKDKQAAFSGRPHPPDEPIVVVPVCKSSLPVIEATPVLYSQAGAEPTAVVATPVFPGQTPGKIFTPVLHQTVPVTVILPRVAPAKTPSFLVPPGDVQLIIDKMASYVAKNGRDFESIVRSKGDPRFEFLQVQHQYYPYYLHKVDVFEQLEAPSVATVLTEAPEVKQETPADPSDSSDTSSDEGDALGHLHKPALAPVCFSIKKPKEPDQVLDMKSALPLEESSDEEKTSHEEEAEKADVEVESIDLTQDSASNMDSVGEQDERRIGEKDRPWEERVKDKLAAAAREKLAATTREKQLQLERKRRAAAFLNMIHKSQPKPSHVVPPTVASAGEEDDVSSIPSPMSTNSSSANVGIDDGVGVGSSLLARIQGGKEVERRRRGSGSESDAPVERRKSKKRKTTHNRSRKSPSPVHSHRHNRADEHTRSKKQKKQSRTKSPSSSKSHRELRTHHHSNETSTARSSESRSKKKKSHKSRRDRKSTSSEHSS